VDDLARTVEGNDLIATYDEFQQRAASIVLSKEARGAFAIEQESHRLRDRHGRNTFGQSCLLARRLVERGVRFVTVNFGGWDHHAKIWDGLKGRLPELDAGLSALVGDMGERGLLKDTLVVVRASSAARRRSTRTSAATTGGRRTSPPPSSTRWASTRASSW
jgi:uncharacterized protein (DUF1501 family)